MRRLTSIKRSKSPPPSSYSMDNPVFEDSVSVATAHPVHVRYTKKNIFSFFLLHAVITLFCLLAL